MPKIVLWHVTIELVVQGTNDHIRRHRWLFIGPGRHRFAQPRISHSANFIDDGILRRRSMIRVNLIFRIDQFLCQSETLPVVVSDDAPTRSAANLVISPVYRLAGFSFPITNLCCGLRGS